MLCKLGRFLASDYNKIRLLFKNMDRIIEKKRFSAKRISAYIIGLLVATTIIWSISTGGKTKVKIDTKSINIANVSYGYFNDFIRVSGKVQPISIVQISPLEGGIIHRIVRQEGALLKEGDTIVVLKNSQLSLSILESEASLAEKENFLRNTLVQMEQQKLDLQQSRLQLNYDITRKERQYIRNSNLFKERLISKEEYLLSKEDYEYSLKSMELIIDRQIQDSIYRTIQIKNMEESLISMRKSMVMIKERMDNLIIKSRIDGQLSSLDIVLGQSISAGSNIGKISNLNDYIVEANIDEFYIDKVYSGIKAQFERQSQQYSLEVKKVYPDVKEGVFKTEMIFLSERPDNIRTGQTYYINMELGEPIEGVIIPKGNFFSSTGGNWIYVLNSQESKAYKREIKIISQNPNYYLVESGLEPGEKVIISDYDRFGNNEILILK